MENEPVLEETESHWVFKAQLLIIIGFTCFAAAVILWICRLIYVSWDLKDTFSGSISIAIVAGTIFLVILSIFHYLVWGLIREKKSKLD
ncbi:MAG: hypothetical protein OEY59_12410 [Deltaproteobacteria bacterium]|nr:hypothetical protein [Deltaproteobacteria bacterium]